MGDRVYDAVIIGAGVAGLSAARALSAAGRDVVVLDAAAAPGGRVRTDMVEGFRIDRGFQVLNTAYPEVRTQLDAKALNLRTFDPGALVFWNGRFHRLFDPLRRPGEALHGLFAPVGTLADKLRILALRRELVNTPLAEMEARPDITTIERLERFGFSSSIIERFFRPFYGGVFLDRSLTTSSRTFDFTFRMFAAGDAAVPAEGMAAVPAALAAALPADGLRLNARVHRLVTGGVELVGGSVVHGRDVVVATGETAAALLLREPPAERVQRVTTISYVAERSPVGEPVLLLDGEGTGPVNHVAVMTDVAPSYAPPGAHLITCTVPGDAPTDDDRLDIAARAQLSRWFGTGVVSGWRRLHVDHLAYALPRHAPGGRSPDVYRKITEHLWLCGDHLNIASLHHAMLSGRLVGKAIAERPRN